MTNGELVLSYLGAFSSGDPELIAEHVSDDFENIQVGVLGTGCKGKDTYRRRLGDFLANFSHLQYHLKTMIIEGDEIAAPYRMTFTQADQAFDIQGVMLITVHNGQIAVRRDYWDGLDYKKQAAG